MNKTRPKSIAFRVSSSEWELLQARIKNSGFNSQQFLLRAVLEKPIVNKEAFHELLVELRREGSNLNQIARACNSGRLFDVAEAVVAASQKLEKIWQNIRLFLELEWQGVDLSWLAAFCRESDSCEKDIKKIKEELNRVCQFLKL